MNLKIEDKGTYCLIIKINKESKIKIGAKGIITFNEGYYVYIGSALNSLSNRIKRHISTKKKKHWHIDYLLLNKNTELKEVIYTYYDKKIECNIADEINKNTDKNIELFGCSDCNCTSHLYYFNSIQESIKCCEKAYEKINCKPIKWFN